jgi:hypothetical protein
MLDFVQHYDLLLLWLSSSSSLIMVMMMSTTNGLIYSVILVLSFIQGDQKGSVHLMVTIQKVTNNVQSVPHQSPNIY